MRIAVLARSLIVVGATLVGCNAITGVNDLRFGSTGSGGSSGSSGASGSASSGGDTSSGGAETGGAGGSATGGAAGGTGDGLSQCGLVFTDAECAACVAVQCCDAATTCSANADCTSFRDCYHACIGIAAPNDYRACTDKCFEQHQCGVNDWYSYNDCAVEKCPVACSLGGGKDAGSPTDGGDTGGGADAGLGGGCDESPCDPVKQCGCSGGQACIVSDLITGETKCTPVGTYSATQLCNSDTDCVPGAGCVEGVCKLLCNTSADCPTGGHCYSMTHDAPACTRVITPGAGYCTADCDPVKPSAACGSGVNCNTYSLDENTKATDCVTAGSGIGLGTCPQNGSSDCAPGYDCVTYTGGAAKTSTCAKWCRLNTGSDCGTSERCVPFNPGVTLHGITYGYCAKQCDLLDPGLVCKEGSCGTVMLSNTVATDCFPAGGGVGAGACSAANTNTCAPGYNCVSYGNPAAYTCEAWCDQSHPSCPQGTTCNGLTPFTLGGTTYSTCH